MTQTYAVTGAASGIGKATKEQLEALGNRTIGIDIHDTDVVVDLATVDGREALVKEVTELSGGVLDGVAAVAGLSGPTVATAQVNYFGAVATLEGLRPLLEKADAPRAVLVSSMASLFPFDPELAVALDAGDERAAVARARALEAAGGDEGALIYGTTKRGIIRWMRRVSATPEWAGKGISLNAVAPGLVETPMIAEMVSTPEKLAAMLERVPMPLNGMVQASDVAEVLLFLLSPTAGHLCGQTVFVDGGSDVVIRGESIFPID
jgi:NAD(P)-dependent dehydrogenase (short-subunit alcohol dehydrogenase family)